MRFTTPIIILVLLVACCCFAQAQELRRRRGAKAESRTSWIRELLLGGDDAQAADDNSSNSTSEGDFALASLFRTSKTGKKKAAKRATGRSKKRPPLRAPPRAPPGHDLGIRFSKIVWKNSSDIPDFMYRRMTPLDYPIHGEVAYWVRQSYCWSVILKEDCFECEVPFATLVSKIGGSPSHPSSHPHAPYWDELREVVHVQKQRLAGADPLSVMPLADTWRQRTIAEVAEAVHDEYPASHHASLIEYLINDMGVKVDQKIIHPYSVTEFLREIIMLADLNTWAFGTIGPHNFGVKWYEGRVRPEEVAWMIAQGNLTIDVVPEDLVNDIMAMGLTKAEDFTAYPEGCPMHPSWPAMHSASSVGSLWLAVVLDLTEEQWCQAKLVDYNIAYARTVAGVHYSTDNIAGLTLGQELLAIYLPKHLAERYGSDETLVREKIEHYRFDWNEFASSECARNAQQVRA